jgi:hypothetical protein
MVAEQQLEYHSAILAKLAGICLDAHSCARRRRASGFNPTTLIFNHAHTAGTICRKMAVIAKRRHFDIALADYLKEILLALYRYR